MALLEYESTFIKIARDVILQEAGQYNASDYWLQRQGIGEEMLYALNNSLAKAHAHCIYLQLL